MGDNFEEIECLYCGEFTDPPDEDFEKDKQYEVECLHCEELFYAINNCAVT